MPSRTDMAALARLATGSTSLALRACPAYMWEQALHVHRRLERQPLRVHVADEMADSEKASTGLPQKHSRKSLDSSFTALAKGIGVEMIPVTAEE